MRETPLYNCHIQANAQMMDYYGWALPANFGPIDQEILAVRRYAGIFDITPLMVVDIVGAKAKPFLKHVLANNIELLREPGKALYSCLLNEEGGVISLGFVYHLDDHCYRLIFSAVSRERAVDWLINHAKAFGIDIVERQNHAIISIEGPRSLEVLEHAVSLDMAQEAINLKPFYAVSVKDWFISRTGYAGEDGFDILLPNTEADFVWRALIEKGAVACGIEARNILRLEAGLKAYGQEVDETVTPLETGLGWSVAYDPRCRDFIGRGILEHEKQKKPKTVLMGLVLQDEVLSPGDKVYDHYKEIGVVKSACYSPTLQRGIAFAMVSPHIEEYCEVIHNEKRLTALVIMPPFVRAGRANFIDL